MTFFLFKYDPVTENFDKILGPLFHEEVPSAKSFLGEGVSMLEETVFASRFPREYRNHKHMYWMDTMRTYVLQNSEWIGNCYMNAEHASIASNWFQVYQLDPNKRSLKISMCITANRFHEAKFIMDVKALFPLFEIEQGDVYYHGSDKITYTGESAGHEEHGAYQRMLAEKLAKYACLT